MLQTTLVEGHKQKCGYAGIADMATGQQTACICLSVSPTILHSPARNNHLLQIHTDVRCDACIHLHRNGAISAPDAKVSRAMCCVRTWLTFISFHILLQCHTTYVSCGVATGELEDSMESFFLSETCKYLYLLHANTTHLPNNYVFTTEGHLVPPFNASLYPPAGPNNQATAWTHPFHSASAWFMPDFSTLWMPLSDLASEGLVHSDGPLPPNIGGAVPAAIAERCASLCSSISDADMEEKQRVLQAALPLVPLAAQDAVILRQDFNAGFCWLEPHDYSHCCQLHAAGTALQLLLYSCHGVSSAPVMG